MSAPLRAKRFNQETPLGMRLSIAGKLLQSSKNGRILRGTVPAIANEYGISKSTIYRIHKKTVKSLADGKLDLSSARRKRCGRKAKNDPIALQQALEDVPFSERTTIRDAARSIGIPLSSFQYQLTTHDIARRHTNCLKPILTAANKAARYEFAKGLVVDVEDGVIDEMFDVVHVDEKMFVITRKRQNYYITPFEEPPERSVKNSQHPIQVMFIVAYARPRYCEVTGEWFDGKIGCWPFVVQQAAKRNSKNRPAGTMETKSIRVTKEVYREFLLKKIIPAIRQKWPLSYFDDHLDHSKTIWIQQDNAKVHVSPTDAAVVQGGKRFGYDIRVKNQPANSPDFNVCDLGLFHALDSMQFKIAKTTMDGLISAVITSFQEMEMTKINNCFITLQRCISEIIIADGNNNYKIPHMRRARRLRANQPLENAGLTYLARMHLRRGLAAYGPVHLFGSDDSDLDEIEDESVVVLESSSGNALARMPVVGEDDDSIETVEAG